MYVFSDGNTYEEKWLSGPEFTDNFKDLLIVLKQNMNIECGPF